MIRIFAGTVAVLVLLIALAFSMLFFSGRPHTVCRWQWDRLRDRQARRHSVCAIYPGLS